MCDSLLNIISFVRLSCHSRVRDCEYEELLNIAQRNGWTHPGLAEIVEKGTASSAIFSESGNLSTPPLSNIVSPIALIDLSL